MFDRWRPAEAFKRGPVIGRDDDDEEEDDDNDDSDDDEDDDEDDDGVASPWIDCDDMIKSFWSAVLKANQEPDKATTYHSPKAWREFQKARLAGGVSR